MGYLRWEYIVGFIRPEKSCPFWLVFVCMVLYLSLLHRNIGIELPPSRTIARWRSGTAGQRMFTWGIGWEMFLANPVLGVGQANFPWTSGEYMGGRTWQTKSLSGRQAHSLYFTLLPELGLVGVMIFGSMVYFNYRDTRIKQLTQHTLLGSREAFRKGIDSQLSLAALHGNAILGGMIGYLATSTFISTLYYPTFWIMMALAVALRNTTNAYTARQAEIMPAQMPLKVSPWMRPRPAR